MFNKNGWGAERERWVSRPCGMQTVQDTIRGVTPSSKGERGGRGPDGGTSALLAVDSVRAGTKLSDSFISNNHYQNTNK